MKIVKEGLFFHNMNFTNYFHTSSQGMKGYHI